MMIPRLRMRIAGFAAAAGRCLLFSLVLALALATPSPPAAAQEALDGSTCWQEVAETLGVSFHHRHFGVGEKSMPENMGAGVALFDANGDGRLDIYLVQGAPLADPSTTSADPSPPDSPAAERNRLFLQGRDGRFIDGTEASGLGDTGYGMGVTLGDIEGDGDLDVYLTNFGPDVLYRNRGDGTFEDITQAAGLGLDGWSSGAAFVDLDGDGHLDLFVSRYLSYDLANSKWCGNARRKLRSYCHPDIYDGATDRLYRNRGNGTFEDVSVAAKLQPAAQAKGLGVLTYDLDGDGHQDIYVANDSTMNFFYRGDGTGKLQEEALLSGLGFNASGGAEASMGIAYGDFDADGSGELFLTHLDQETNTLYRPANGLFVDATRRAGLDRGSLPWVGFGTVSLDFDHDGDLDLFVGNGHIIDNIALFDSSRSHRQPAQLYRNEGKGTFRDASHSLGPPTAWVARGVATGDLDGDGDLDLVVTQNGDRALVLRNGCSEGRASLSVRLRQPTGNTQALGARLQLRPMAESAVDPTVGPVAGSTATATQTRFIVGGGSYLSYSPLDAHFGLNATEEAAPSWQLSVRWPDGTTQVFDKLRPAGTYTITRGAENIQRRAYVERGTSEAQDDAPKDARRPERPHAAAHR